MSTVIESLKELGVPEEHIRTTRVSLWPIYESNKAESPEIVGYRANSQVRVTTLELDKLGAIIDRSIGAGANRIDGLSFRLSDEKAKKIVGDAMTKAAEDAQDKANAVADALGVTLGKIVGISESVSYPTPITLAREAAVTPVPIEPGELELSVTLQVSFAVG